MSERNGLDEDGMHGSLPRGGVGETGIVAGRSAKSRANGEEFRRDGPCCGYVDAAGSNGPLVSESTHRSQAP